jgi:hypothetical protein
MPQAAANAAEAELAEKETALEGDAGSVKEQLLTALDIKYGSMIRRLQKGVDESSAAVRCARAVREEKEGRAQVAGQGVGSLRDAANAADAVASDAMEAAERSVQDDVQAQEEMKAAQTALTTALAAIQKAAAGSVAAEAAEVAEQKAAVETPPVGVELTYDSIDEAPASISSTSNKQVDKVLQEVESVLATMEADIVSSGGWGPSFFIRLRLLLAQVVGCAWTVGAHITYDNA